VLHPRHAGAARPQAVPRDVDYIVKDGQVVIIDEFTGRMMSGRATPRACTRRSRPRKGRDPAREPDAGLDHLPEPLPHVSQAGRHDRHGDDEASEFGEIYRLEVVEIRPTCRSPARTADDEIYRTLADKTRAIVKLIEDCRERQQPMLVGTVSIEKSEGAVGGAEEGQDPAQRA
jgi:preprotein translocase subunit SecA